MMRRLYRKRGWWLAAMSVGICFQLNSCTTEAQLTLIRIGFSSVTLPFNQAISGIYGLATAIISNFIAGAITGT